MDLTKSKTHIRESRDSEEHPESLPVFIALDETGSMGSIPDKMTRDYLPKLMDSIIDSIGGSIFKEINNPYETNLNNLFKGNFKLMNSIRN